MAVCNLICKDDIAYSFWSATHPHMIPLVLASFIPLQRMSPESHAYTSLVSHVAAAFHAAIPGSRVTVDVPWSPYDIDGRNYDWKGLVEAADVFFVMMYDTQSQVSTQVANKGCESSPCFASTTSTAMSATSCLLNPLVFTA